MELRLMKPSIKYAEQVMRFKEDMLASKSLLAGTSGLGSANSFEEWVDFENRGKKQYGKKYRPSHTFLCVRAEDDKLVGFIEYRPLYTRFLKKHGGNIGYCVHPFERKKGYGTAMLTLLLPICKELGEKKILIVCDKENEGSKKVILNNGGSLKNEIKDKFNLGKSGILQRYWIMV